MHEAEKKPKLPLLESRLGKASGSETSKVNIKTMKSDLSPRSPSVRGASCSDKDGLMHVLIRFAVFDET